MVKNIKYLFIILMMSFVLILCTFTGYEGDYPGLYSVATNSVLGNSSYEEHTDSKIIIIEEDSFGRKLFSYTEERLTFSILIIQKSDDNYSY